MNDFGPEPVDLFTDSDGTLVRLDYAGSAPAEVFAESPGLYCPSLYRMTGVADGGTVHEFVVFGEGGFSPYEMALHLAVSREGFEPVPAEPSMNESLVCEHGLSAALCAGPGHYPMD
jgi:hypothetical protein